MLGYQFSPNFSGDAILYGSNSNRLILGANKLILKYRWIYKEGGKTKTFLERIKILELSPTNFKNFYKTILNI